jgi:hypothetical protein
MNLKKGITIKQIGDVYVEMNSVQSNESALKYYERALSKIHVELTLVELQTLIHAFALIAGEWGSLDRHEKRVLAKLVPLEKYYEKKD